MSECLNCGNAVSKSFARVYGTENGILYRCMDCVESGSILRHGGGAIEDINEVVRRMNTES